MIPPLPVARPRPLVSIIRLTAVIAAASAAVLWYLHPFLSDQIFSVPSHYPDTCEVVWTAWFSRRAAAGLEPSFYQTHSLFWPEGASLYLHATVELLVVPLALLFQQLTPMQIYSWACAISIILSLACFAAVVFALSRSIMLSALAVLAAMSANTVGHLDAGHLNMLCVFPLVLFLGAMAELISNRWNQWWGAAFAFSIIAMSYSNLYYLYFACLMIPFAMYAAFRQIGLKTVVLNVAPWGGLAMLAALPKWWGVISLTLSGLYEPNHEALNHSADLASFFVPGINQYVGMLSGDFLAGVRVNSGESGVYLGYGLLIYLAWHLSAVRWNAAAKCFIFLAGLFFFVSLGPAIEWRGAEIVGNPVFLVLDYLLPSFPSVPARAAFLTPMLLIFACAAAEPLPARSRFAPAYGAAAILMLAVEFFPVPVRGMTYAASPAVAYLRDTQSVRAIHDSALMPWNTMMRQVYHGKPIDGGFISRRPRKALARLRNNDFVRCVERGASCTDETIRKGWRELGVTTLVVERWREKIIKRVRAVPWLEERAVDEQIVVFSADEASSTAE